MMDLGSLRSEMTEQCCSVVVTESKLEASELHVRLHKSNQSCRDVNINA